MTVNAVIDESETYFYLRVSNNNTLYSVHHAKFLYHNGESCRRILLDVLLVLPFFMTFPTMRNHFRGIPRKIYNFRRNRPRNLREQICNRREQVVRAGCKLLRANCQSKYQHCGGSLQSCAEKNIRFDCKRLTYTSKVPIWPRILKCTWKRTTYQDLPRVSAHLVPQSQKGH